MFKVLLLYIQEVSGIYIIYRQVINLFSHEPSFLTDLPWIRGLDQQDLFSCICLFGYTSTAYYLKVVNAT